MRSSVLNESGSFDAIAKAYCPMGRAGRHRTPKLQNKHYSEKYFENNCDLLR